MCVFLMNFGIPAKIFTTHAHTPKKEKKVLETPFLILDVTEAISALIESDCLPTQTWMYIYQSYYF